MAINAHRKWNAQHWMIMEHIIKKDGKKEKFDERKIYATCFAAALNTQIEKHEAEKLCEKVCKEIKQWVKKKKSVTSTEVFQQVVRAMKKHDRNVAFMYETHRDLS